VAGAEPPALLQVGAVGVGVGVEALLKALLLTMALPLLAVVQMVLLLMALPLLVVLLPLVHHQRHCQPMGLLTGAVSQVLRHQRLQLAMCGPSLQPGQRSRRGGSRTRSCRQHKAGVVVINHQPATLEFVPALFTHVAFTRFKQGQAGVAEDRSYTYACIMLLTTPESPIQTVPYQALATHLGHLQNVWHSQ
jgi:hypothetical protein